MSMSMDDPSTETYSNHDEADRDEADRDKARLVTALVIPAEGPVEEVQLPAVDALRPLQKLVEGYIEAIPLPDFVDPTRRSTAYINEDGKYRAHCRFNGRATDFFVPGVGLFHGDHISGTCVLVGFDIETGEHIELPQSVIDRVRLIECEAS